MSSGESPAVKFYDFPADHYPFTITIKRADTGAELWRQTVDGPGIGEVPALGPRPVVVRIEFANGKVSEWDSSNDA